MTEQLDLPTQEKKEEIRIPVISRHLSFIQKTTWEYKDLTPEIQIMIEQNFQESFTTLLPEEQKSVTLELEALSVEIASLAVQNKGIALIRRSEIVNHILEVMDRGGVVASATKGNIDHIRKEVAESANNTAAYLNEYEAFANSAKHQSEEIKQNSEYLLMIISGINQELARLRLANITNPKSQGELQNERYSQFPPYSSVHQFGKQLEKLIENEGLIGFSTLNKLIKEFHSAKNTFAESISI